MAVKHIAAGVQSMSVQMPDHIHDFKPTYLFGIKQFQCGCGLYAKKEDIEMEELDA